MTNEEKRKRSRIFSQNTLALAGGKISSDSKPQLVKSRIFGRTSQDEGRTISTAGYLAGKAVSGALGVVEGTTDLLAGLGALLTGDRDQYDYCKIQ